MRGLEIAGADNKLARHMGIQFFKACDLWLWHFHNRHGIGNKVERGESSNADISAVELFRLKFNTLLKKTST